MSGHRFRRERGPGRPRRGLGLVLGALVLATATACSAFPGGPAGAEGGEGARAEAVNALDLEAVTGLESLLPRLAEHRVVYVSETHDRFDHHLNQLAVIRGLHDLDPDLAIGVEFFQQPFQEHLDAYVAGEIGEDEMLERTEYFDRWRFDYRLYRPILQYAREQGIPVIALNVPGELTRKAGREGLDALTPEERARLPADIDRSDADYEARLREVFDMHPSREDGGFESFVTVQLLWDEGMAERAARYLDAHPQERMVVLAGGGHVLYGSGIPSRVARRTGASQVIVLNDTGGRAVEPAMGDYLLLPRERELPPAGRLGVFLDPGDDGVRIRSFAEDSGAREAGLEEGDRLVAVDGRAVDSYADVRIALFDKRPGEQVRVRVARKALIAGERERTLEVTLR
jgi:uncharacterized iron-regulated protein